MNVAAPETLKISNVANLFCYYILYFENSHC